MGFMDAIGQVLGGFNAVKQIDTDGFDFREKRAAAQAARDQELQQYEQTNQDYLAKSGAEAMVGGAEPQDVAAGLPASLTAAQRKFAIDRAAGGAAQSKSSLLGQKAQTDYYQQAGKDAAAMEREKYKGELKQTLMDKAEAIRSNQQLSPAQKDAALLKIQSALTLFGVAEAGRNSRFQQAQSGIEDRFNRGASGGGGRPMASGDVNRISEMDTALGLLQNELGPQMGETGAGSKIGAMMPNFISEYTGIGTESKARQALIDKAKQIIGKSLEGGVLRKEDEVKYTKILPTIGDPPDVAMEKVQGLADTIGMKREDLLAALSTAGYRTSGFQRPKGGGDNRPVVAFGGKKYRKKAGATTNLRTDYEEVP